MSNPTVKPNPLLDPQYSNIVSSNDPDAIIIVNNFKNIYNNYVTFSNTAKDVVDTVPLDNAAVQIQTSFDEITKKLTPCINDPTDYRKSTKCASNSNCKWAADVENLAMEFIILTSNMTINNGELKEQYKFIGFFITLTFVDLITNNKTGNFNPYDQKYYLCTGNPYVPKSSDPALKKAFDALQARMVAQRNNNNQRVSDETTKNFLLYILLPTVIFIILMLIYVFVFRAKKSEPVTSITGSEEPPKTGSEESPKTGGALYDTLNFISTIGLKLIRS